MHGLVFVTWEKYLAERFGSDILARYKTAIGEGLYDAPLVTRVYDDAALPQACRSCLSCAPRT